MKTAIATLAPKVFQIDTVRLVQLGFDYINRLYQYK